MLVLNFIDEREPEKKPKNRKRKKIKTKEYNRYSINVKGKTVTVLDLNIKDLKNEDVLTLLKIYKGRVMVPQKYKYEEPLREYLFNPVIYYQRALISSLVNQVKAVNKEWKCIYLKTESFIPFDELYELVRISKSVTLLTENNSYTEAFRQKCYYEYGAVISVKKEDNYNNAEVFVNLNEVDKSGKLMINVRGRQFLLYPDSEYFVNNPEYQKLSAFGIEHNVICGAFSGK